MKIVVAILAVVGITAGGWYYYTQHFSADPPSNFRTATVTRGDMLPTISATGTAEPEDLIDVGAQVNGLIASLGPDPQNPKKSVDWCSVVKTGTLLARIEDSLYKAQVDSAQAAYEKAKADLEQMKAKLLQAENDWKRADSLIKTHAIADTDYDAAVANYKVAEANVGVDEAAIKEAEAALNLAKTNLGYTIIKSPVNGTVISRRVNIGQTVVASLSAPSLFLIAKDLHRMQIWTSVNEADIGRIHVGQEAHFSVDAYPNETFYGTVAQIRPDATMTQNVVTYTVVVDHDNSSEKILPYMTANVQFEIDHHPGVLLVPNGALRWKPRPVQIVPELRASLRGALNGHDGSHKKDGGDKQAADAQGGTKDGGSPGEKEGSRERPWPPRGERSKSADGGKLADAKAGDAPRTPGPRPAVAKKEHSERGRVWVKDDNYVRPIDVHIVATDGTNTEVTGKELQENMEVVVGENAATDDSSDTTNPFAPKLFNKGAKKN
jgi:HlyD family secretion protein